MFGKSSNRRGNKEQNRRPFGNFWKFWKSTKETVDEPSDTADGRNTESVGKENPVRESDLYSHFEAEGEAWVLACLLNAENLLNTEESNRGEEFQGASRGRQHRSARRGGIRRWERERRESQACMAQQAVETQKKRDALGLVGVCVEVVKVTETNCVGPGGNVMDLSLEVLTQLRWVTWNFKQVLPQISIHKVEYVLNDRLYKLFNETKAEFRLHGKSTTERLLYHGTKAANVNR